MHNLSRRKFVGEVVGVAGALLVGAKMPGATEVIGSTRLGDELRAPEGELFSRMKWMNEPASAAIAGGKLTVRSRPKTDFWRKTFFGYVTDNGHFFYLRASGDFVFEARIDGQYEALYDQAGLMARIDAQNWVKCGTEVFDNARHASVVFTREFSDGSTMKDLVTSGPVWWRIVRKPDSIETLCSADGKNFTSVRLGYFVPSSAVDVGIMCAAPEGKGFQSVFDDLKLTTVDK
jgi:hypothetical protein